MLGIAPQDVKEFSHTWWYELIINIVAIVVLIGLGAILPSIRRREEKYGIAFDKKQWTTIFVLIIGSIILNVWLGGTKIAWRGLMIIIESAVALCLVFLIGRRKPESN